MAVTLTAAQLSAALRLGSTPEETAEASRLLTYSSVAVEQHAPGAPEAVQNEAAIRLAAYLFDQPNAGRGMHFANAIRNSGAARILLPYRVHRAGSTGAAAASSSATPDVPIPVPATGGLDQAQVQALIDAALRTHSAEANVHHAPPTVPPAYELPAAAPGVRGGVQAVTNSIIDTGTSTGIFGWGLSHVRRMVEAVVPSWARAATPPEQFTHVPAADVAQATDDNDFVLANVSLPAVGNGLTFRVPRALIAGHIPVLHIGTTRALIRRADGGLFAASHTDISANELLVLVRVADSGGVQFRAIGRVASTGGTTLPDYEQSETRGLFSRAGALFWSIVNAVPNTPGEASGVGSLLAVTGENDRDYTWRKPSQVITLANRGGLAFDGQGQLHTSPSLVATAAEADANATAIAAETRARDAADTALGTRIDSLQDAGHDAMARAAIAQEVTVRAAADTALGERITALDGYAAPVFEPSYWVKTGDARTILVHLDPRADAITGLAKVRLTVQGVVKTLDRTANQDVYAFAFTASDAANITRAAGNAGADTVHADVTLLDASDGELQRWRGLLRVLDSAPDAGGGEWHWIGFASFPANSRPVAVNLRRRGFNIDGVRDEAGLRAKILDGTVKHFAVRITQNDVGDADSDGIVHMVPNQNDLKLGNVANVLWVFPGWADGRDPRRWSIEFGQSAITVTPDSSTGATSYQVRLGVFA